MRTRQTVQNSQNISQDFKNNSPPPESSISTGGADPNSEKKSKQKPQKLQKQQQQKLTPSPEQKPVGKKLGEDKKKEGYWAKLDRSEIRRIKSYIFSIEIILFVLLILGAMYEGIVVEPFYFPLGYLLMFIIFIIFLISIQGLWFKFIMIKTARSFNKRMALIKDYQSSAQQALVTSIVILIIILSFTFLPFVSDAIKSEETFYFSSNDSEQSTNFEEQDSLGITQVKNIILDSNNTVELKLHVQEIKKDYNEGNIEEKYIGNYTEVDYSLQSPGYGLGYSPNKKYHLFIINVGNKNVSGKYTIEREVSKIFVFNILLFMILFVMISIIWLAYLSTIKKKFSKLHSAKVDELTKRYAVKPYTIEDVFFIHENGTLLSHQTRRLKPMDNDILSGMLTAIKDFIRDVFKADAKGQLKELTFGDMKILIEHGQHSFLAVVVSGTAPKDLRNKMKNMTSQISQQFAHQLKTYSGDARRFLGVKKIIEQSLFAPDDENREIDFDTDSAWNNKGVVLTRLGKYNEAIECFDKALKINSHVSNIWLNRGIALVKINEFEEAMDCFDRALQLDPGNETAKRRRKKCWYKWKLLEGREGQIKRVSARSDRATSSSSRSGGSRPEEYSYDTYREYDYDYARSPRRDEGLGGPGSVSSSPSTSRDYYSGTGYSPGTAASVPSGGAQDYEQTPICPSCGNQLEFVEEYNSWYCAPCDSYPYDD